MRYDALMPRSLTLLLILLALGSAAGIWLSSKDNSAAPSSGSAEHNEDPVTSLDRKQALPVDGMTKAAEVPAGPIPDEDDPDFHGIAIELLKTRGLQALPINTKSVEVKEVTEVIAKWLSDRFSKDYGMRQGRAFAALGAIPEAVDTLALRAAFWSHQIGAWYDEEGETVYIAPAADESKENALGLAFAHLMRENGAQLFPKNKDVSCTDAWLASLSLLAGDAAFTRLLHSLSHPKTGGGGGVSEDPDDPSRSFNMPNFLRELELAPFGVGMDFVRGLHEVAKFDQVNAVYSRPPVSCHEVLEPEAYLNETQFQPAAIDWEATKVNGLVPFWDDRLGPVAMVLWLKQQVPQLLAAETAPGWRGDRLLSYPAAGKSRDHVAWQTIWKDSNAADAFFSAARQGLMSRYKGAVPAPDAPGGIFKLEGPERFVVLTRTHEGRGVFYADAADAAFADALWRKLVAK